MILVKPSSKVLSIMDQLPADSLGLIELAGRTCYKSEDRITPDSSLKFVADILKLGHESVIEHSAMTVKFICDRGVTHELVRHRLCAFSQESTRYCNYSGGVTFVIPPWVNVEEGNYTEDNTLVSSDEESLLWFSAMWNLEGIYTSLIGKGWTPQQARSVLPNSLKTEIVVTANFREWRHIFKLRCAKAAHPQMREVMIPLHEECKRLIPIIFDDIEY